MAKWKCLTNEMKARYLIMKPQRTRQSMHECCLCKLTIEHLDTYYDGGFGKRAHGSCVMNVLNKKEVG